MDQQQAIRMQSLIRPEQKNKRFKEFITEFKDIKKNYCNKNQQKVHLTYDP
ncbi:MAG: hypothetical protein ACK518_04035 [bacterium]